jgi:hypothetical protein
MQDVMLDLETMGNGPNAAIVAVGAIEFDAATNTLGQRFYRGVNLETAVAEGGVIDASTVMWWLRQSDEARKDICGDGLPLRQVLAEFSEWLASLGEGVKVWGKRCRVRQRDSGPGVSAGRHARAVAALERPLLPHGESDAAGREDGAHWHPPQRH